MNNWGDRYPRLERPPIRLPDEGDLVPHIYERRGIEPHGHVHFRPHRWSWGSASVGWALGVAMVCGAQWLHAHGSGWALGFWGALLAMYPLWLVGSVE